MKITKVKYQKLITIEDRFDNISFGAEADVEENETPEDARTNLVYWVNEYLNKLGYNQDTVDDLEDKIRSLMREEENHGNEIKKLIEIKTKMIEFLEKHGCNIKRIMHEWESEVPF